MAKTSKKIQLKSQTRTTKQLRKTRKITKNKIGGEPGRFRRIAQQLLGTERVEAIKAGLKERGVIRKSEETINDRIVKLYEDYICPLLGNNCLNTIKNIIEVFKMYLYILILYIPNIYTIKEALDQVEIDLSSPNKKFFYSINDKFVLVRSTNIENFTALFNALQEKHISDNSVYYFLTNYKELPQFENNPPKIELFPYLYFVEKIDELYNKLVGKQELTLSDRIDICFLRQTINNKFNLLDFFTQLIHNNSGIGNFNHNLFKQRLMYILNPEEEEEEDPLPEPPTGRILDAQRANERVISSFNEKRILESLFNKDQSDENFQKLLQAKKNYKIALQNTINIHQQLEQGPLEQGPLEQGPLEQGQLEQGQLEQGPYVNRRTKPLKFSGGMKNIKNSKKTKKNNMKSKTRK